MSSWLPLLMPRPELFESDTIPDIGHRDQPEILVFGAGRRNDSDPGLWSADDYKKLALKPVPEELHSWKIEADSSAARTLVSLPIFTWCYIFAEGHSDDALHRASDVHASNLKIYVTRSFVTWMAGPTMAPLYRLDRMKWQNHVPDPGFEDLDADTGIQVILPFDRLHGSAHEKMHTSACLEPDLAMLAQALGWSSPLRPRRIDMPKYMA